ncbi:MAG: nucleoside phosphorylase [Ruminococcus sp.]|nr:nucleoside phosphorylase [Ruminococcus sp.]
MSIIKNDIPLAEFDDSRKAVFEPEDFKAGFSLPEKAVFAFVGNCTDSYAEACGAETVTEIETITRFYPVYVRKYKDQDICFIQAPMGASAAAEILEALIACGVKKVLAAGSCGVLVDLPENEFVIPERALRDEGTSYHYLPPSRFIELDSKMTDKLCRCFDERGIHYKRTAVWTTDGLFRETPEKVKYRLSEGCEVVDMECSALAAVCRFRGVDFAQFFYTADSLADVENYDLRDFGRASQEKALALCMDIIADM